MSSRDPSASPRISARRASRLQAREQQRSRERQRRRMRTFAWVGAGVAALAVIGLIVFFNARQTQAQPGRFVAIQGAQHIQRGESHVAYSTRPPTSGPHWSIAGEAPVAWGVYKAPIPDEAQIHNLEHGGIMIQYSCRDCPELEAQLEDFYDRYTRANQLPLLPNSTKIVVAPYYDMPSRIALTGWGRIDTFDTYDEQRLVRFVEAWRGKGPEPTVP